MMEEEKSPSEAKKMLLEILASNNNKNKGAVYVENGWDELEEEESQEYFEPPTVPKSWNGQNTNKIKNTFKINPDHTLTSDDLATQSLGSTVSFHTFALDPPMEYEEIIQKLEADIRKHIRIQNQLKLHIESLQSKVDEKEKIDAKRDEKLEESEKIIKKLKQSLIDLDRKKDEEMKMVKEQWDNEVKRLNEKIQKLNKAVFEQSRIDGRNTLVAKAIPHSSIERAKLIDSARSNTVSFLRC